MFLSCHVRVQLQALNLQILRLLRARSSLTFRQLWSVDSLWNTYVIWQKHRVTYLNCILEQTISGGSMAHKVIVKVTARLKFLHWKNKYLTPNLHCLLCHTSIQPQFDYGYSAWHCNLSKNLKNSNFKK